ncbi:hypothetical protein PQX77_021099, partial [Marasmius sp. AFHP31]
MVQLKGKSPPLRQRNELKGSSRNQIPIQQSLQCYRNRNRRWKIWLQSLQGPVQAREKLWQVDNDEIPEVIEVPSDLETVNVRRVAPLSSSSVNNARKQTGYDLNNESDAARKAPKTPKTSYIDL